MEAAFIKVNFIQVSHNSLSSGASLSMGRESLGEEV